MSEKRYKIGELATITNVSTKAIRIYEAKGLLTSYRDETNNYRYFEEDAIVRMQKMQNVINNFSTRLVRCVECGMDVSEKYKIEE